MSYRHVKKGRHRFRPVSWGFTFAKEHSRLVEFLPSCDYDTNQNQNQDDWNKLFGFCSIKGPHHTSYRFGWRSTGAGVIELAAYSYQGGVRSMQHIGQVKIGAKTRLKMRKNGNVIEWIVGEVIVHRLVGHWPGIGWRLGAYFGGDEPAPQNIRLWMVK